MMLYFCPQRPPTVKKWEVVRGSVTHVNHLADIRSHPKGRSEAEKFIDDFLEENIRTTKVFPRLKREVSKDCSPYLLPKKSN